MSKKSRTMRVYPQKQTEMTIFKRLINKNMVCLRQCSSSIGLAHYVCLLLYKFLSRLSITFYLQTLKNRKISEQKNKQASKALSLRQNDNSTVAVWRVARLPIIRRNRTACIVCCSASPTLLAAQLHRLLKCGLL